MNGGSNKSRFELLVELIKVIAWPMIALIVLIGFWQPLRTTVYQLPDLVSRSDTITVAGLSLKIDQNLQLKGKRPSSLVREALSKMEPNDLPVFLSLPIGACYDSNGAEKAKSDFAHLIQLGLFLDVPVSTSYPDAPGCVYGVMITDLGEETQNYLYALIDEFAQQLDEPVITPAATAGANQ